MTSYHMHMHWSIMKASAVEIFGEARVEQLRHGFFALDKV